MPDVGFDLFETPDDPKENWKIFNITPNLFCGEYTIEPQLEKKDKSLHYRWGYSIVYPDILSFQPLGSTNTKKFFS